MRSKQDPTHILLNLKVFLDCLDPSLWEKWHTECALTEFEFYSGSKKCLSLSPDLMKNDKVKSILLDILTIDNWETLATIKMADNTVAKNYVESYLNKVTQIPDKLCKSHQPELTLLVYYAIATRFYIEKTLLKLPMPSAKGSQVDAKKDYELLKNTSGNALDLHSIVGKKAANFFMEDIRFECPTHNKSYKENWNTPLLIGKLVTWMKHHKSISPATMNRLRLDTTVSSFRPAAVKYLVHYIHEKDSSIKISSYLNLCGGWGCRLVGALSTPEITRYIQTDPNPDLLAASKQIYEAYDPQKETEAHFYDKPMEDLTVEELCPDGKKNQFIFFSPPFFNKEKYNGALQSHTRYPKVESWCNDFLYKSLQVSYFSLDNGILAINLANILFGKGNELKLTDCLVHLLEVNMANYFTKFAEPLIYPNQNAPSSYVFMYKTKPYRDSFGIYPNFVMQPDWVIKKKDRTNRKVMTKTSPNPTLAIEAHSVTSSDKETLLPLTIVSKPPIQGTTLFNLHQRIEQCNTLDEVADYYGCSISAVIRRISDWDLRLSFDTLKYKYASSRNFYFYTTWIIINNVLLIDNQPFKADTIYISNINMNPYNPNGFTYVPESDFVMLQVICMNPYGELVNHTISTPINAYLTDEMVFTYLANQGVIKQLIDIPDYYECKSSKRIGNEHLSLKLSELHEIILSEPNPIYLMERLGKTIEGLTSDLLMMGSSLDALKNLTQSEAATQFGNQYHAYCSTLISNTLQHGLEVTPIVEEASLKDTIEIQEIVDDVEEMTVEINGASSKASTLNLGLFPKQRIKTNRDEPYKDESNKKTCYGS